MMPSVLTEEEIAAICKRMGVRRDLVESASVTLTVRSPMPDDRKIPVPFAPCPTVSGGPNAGKRYDELEHAVLLKMYNEYKQRMTDAQKDWCEYLIVRYTAIKLEANAIDSGKLK